MYTKKRNIAIAGSTIAAIAIGIFLLRTVPFFNQYKEPKSASSQTLVSATPAGMTSTEIPSPTPVHSTQTFTDQKLGITFSYAGSNLTTKTVGNTVYVYEATAFDSAQSVQVLTKAPADDIVTAIRKVILGTTYSSSNCKINIADSTANTQLAGSPATYRFAVIHYPTDPNQNSISAAFYSGTLQCPNAYTPNESTGYFMTDINHPDKLVYFNLGQYTIPGSTSSTRSWADTLRFL